MSDLIRKSFNNSSTNYITNKTENKKNNNPGYFLHNQKKLPTIVINSKNSDLLQLSSSEKINSKKIFRQKSLTLSQNKNNIFNKKASTSNFNLRKKSMNQLNILNNVNTINNLNNNIDTLNNNNNITRKNSINIPKNIKLYKSGEIYRNHPNINYTSGMSINPISMLTIKNPDDFEVSEEDRMFNQYKLKKPKSNKVKKAKTKVKIKIKKKKITPFTSYNAALGKVYKKIPKIIDKIENTKKLKDTMSLLKYQNLLMDVGTKNLNRETRQKLNNKFTSIRNFSDKAYVLFKESLGIIETKEKEIIESINTKQNYFKRKMKEKKYKTISASKNPNFFSLPNIKFIKISKSRLKHRK